MDRSFNFPQPSAPKKTENCFLPALTCRVDKIRCSIYDYLVPAS